MIKIERKGDSMRKIYVCNTGAQRRKVHARYERTAFAMCGAWTVHPNKDEEAMSLSNVTCKNCLKMLKLVLRG